MGFQPRARTPRDFGRRPGRNKSQTKPGKRQTGGENRLEEEHVATPTEIVDRTLNSVSRLGSQRFAVAPFHEHYDRWLLNVRNVLSEFEANPAVTIDDRFREERSRVLTEIDLALKDRRVKETSNDEAVRRANRSLLDAKSLLARADREHAFKMNEIAGQERTCNQTCRHESGKGSRRAESNSSHEGRVSKRHLEKDQGAENNRGNPKTRFHKEGARKNRTVFCF